VDVSRKINEKMDIILNKIKEILGVKTDKQLAEFFNLSPTNFNNKKGRDTLTPLIVNWAIHEKVDLNWLFKEKVDNFKMDLEVVYGPNDPRRSAGAKRYNIDPSNTSIPSESSKPPDADPWHEHLLKTRFILESKTGYANSLAANIESFYDAVVTAEKLKDHEKRLEDIEQQLSTGRGKVEDSDAAQAVGS
jgi:hypothetical protein